MPHCAACNCARTAANPLIYIEDPEAQDAGSQCWKPGSRTPYQNMCKTTNDAHGGSLGDAWKLGYGEAKNTGVQQDESDAGPAVAAPGIGLTMQRLGDWIGVRWVLWSVRERGARKGGTHHKVQILQYTGIAHNTPVAVRGAGTLAQAHWPCRCSRPRKTKLPYVSAQSSHVFVPILQGSMAIGICTPPQCRSTCRRAGLKVSQKPSPQCGTEASLQTRLRPAPPARARMRRGSELWVGDGAGEAPSVAEPSGHGRKTAQVMAGSAHVLPTPWRLGSEPVETTQSWPMSPRLGSGQLRKWPKPCRC